MAEIEGAARVVTDRGEAMVVREEPLVIELGAQAVLTMRTPGHDEELARGFLVAEGIVRAHADLEGVELATREGATVARVRLRAGCELGPVARERLSRAHAIRPSCGLCGLASAEGLSADLPALASGPRVTLAALAGLAERMRAHQPLFAATGGCHAAGLFGPDGGQPWVVREDVGRHNALDKALGRALLDGRDLSRAIVVLSGRGGYELVLKALRLAIPVVASVGAPSSLAVELAEERGLTLVGFLREGTGRVYADDGRIA